MNKFCVVYMTLCYVLPNEIIAEFITNRNKDIPNLVHEDMKYILKWTAGNSMPLNFMGDGRSAFVANDCEHKNCVVTGDRRFFVDITDYDAIVFNVRDLNKCDLPKSRSKKQKYIFAAADSNHYYPVCDSFFDNYFNWTWSYKLDSNFKFKYFKIYDSNDKVIGPTRGLKWLKNVHPLDDVLKQKISNKTNVAAWFGSNCKTLSEREKFINDMVKESRKYGWSVDIFGSCGQMKCPRSDTQACYDMLQKAYYFYLAFENSIAKDFVTDTILNAINGFAVPVVYGGANYSEFLPQKSYLNAKELGVQQLVKTMDQMIRDVAIYYDFHRWRTHYKYKPTFDNDDVCDICAALNDPKKMNEKEVRRGFKKWWNISGNICSKYKPNKSCKK